MLSTGFYLTPYRERLGLRELFGLQSGPKRRKREKGIESCYTIGVGPWGEMGEATEGQQAGGSLDGQFLSQRRAERVNEHIEPDVRITAARAPDHRRQTKLTSKLQSPAYSPAPPQMPFPSSPPEPSSWPIPIWRPRGPPHQPTHKKILNLLSPRPKLEVPMNLPLGRPPRLTKPPRRASFEDRAQAHRGHGRCDEDQETRDGPDLTFSESEPSPIPPEMLDLASPISRKNKNRWSGQTFGPISPPPKVVVEENYRRVSAPVVDTTLGVSTKLSNQGRNSWRSSRRLSAESAVGRDRMPETTLPSPPELAPDQMSPWIPEHARAQSTTLPEVRVTISPTKGYSPEQLDQIQYDQSEPRDTTRLCMTMPEPWTHSPTANSSQGGPSRMLHPLGRPLSYPPQVASPHAAADHPQSSRSSVVSVTLDDHHSSIQTAQRVPVPRGESYQSATPIRFSQLFPDGLDKPPTLPKINVRPAFSFRLPPAQPPPEHPPPPLPRKPWSDPSPDVNSQDGGSLASVYLSIFRGKTPFPFTTTMPMPRIASQTTTRRPLENPASSSSDTSATFTTAPAYLGAHDMPLPSSPAMSLGESSSQMSSAPVVGDGSTPTDTILPHHRNALLHLLRLLHCLSLARQLLYARNLVSTTLLHTSPFPPDLVREWERKLDEWWSTSSAILNVARERVKRNLRRAEKDWEWAVEVMGGDVVKEKKGLAKYWEDEDKPGWRDPFERGPGAFGAWDLVGGGGAGAAGVRGAKRRSSRISRCESRPGDLRGATALTHARPGGLKKQPSFLDERSAEAAAGRGDGRGRRRRAASRGVPSWVGEVVHECFGYDEIEAEVWRLEMDGRIPTGTWRRMYGERAFKSRDHEERQANERKENAMTKMDDFARALNRMSKGISRSKLALSFREERGGIVKRVVVPPRGSSSTVSACRDNRPTGWWIMDEDELCDAQSLGMDQVRVDDELSRQRESWRKKGEKKVFWS
ncbi:hypothetical protein BD324DRAFT_608093 [Kockovaella imperatae]|uniref:Uncharacterized protein n=1 Tax=Kockovaella imperatae TaxID=4999 RepID=A0A1Y1UL54_9TREE|nr:hypothetical protein BD324DRAFT_608093 [Kockovaella imperatae]ORX38719.1 hypothetical protein BD324DRAFT_608093 [Kockovaella imperatae]